MKRTASRHCRRHLARLLTERPTGEYRPVLLRNLDGATTTAKITATTATATTTATTTTTRLPITVAAMCDHIAHDRVFVTAKISPHRHFMYTDHGGDGRKSYLLPDTEESVDPTRLVTLEVSDLRALIENENENTDSSNSSNNNNTNSCNNNNTTNSSNTNNTNSCNNNPHEFVYFTSPLKDVAPTYYYNEACQMWKDFHLNLNLISNSNSNSNLNSSSDPHNPQQQPQQQQPHTEGPAHEEIKQQQQQQQQQEMPPLSVWMGGTGVVTQAHYDTDDNVFVQVSGTKRFVFYAPSQSIDLRLYPDCHPRARKSQIDFDVDFEHTSSTTSSTPGSGKFPHSHPHSHPHPPPLPPPPPQPDLEVVLHPGDCIYIPAFWFHHVETLSPSVSINSFVPSPIWNRAETILGLSTPFENIRLLHTHTHTHTHTQGQGQEDENEDENQEEAVKIRVLYAWIETLLPELGYHSPKEFVGDLVESRFDSLTNTNTENDDWDDDWWDDDNDNNNDSATGMPSSPTQQQQQQQQQPQSTIICCVPATTTTINCSKTVCRDEFFRLCLARYVAEFDALELLDGGKDTKGLVVSHLLELWTVRVVGPHRTGNTLRNYSELFSFSP
eukprot:jgi/Psemu1/42200/gm1.42200_g